MKICQINSVYAQGSTGKIVQDIHNTLIERGHESYVIYGDRKGNPHYENVFSVSNKLTRRISVLINRFVGLQYAGAFFQTRRALGIIRKLNPNVVHIQNINGGFVNIYKLLSFLAKNNIKTVVSIHGEFMYTGSCGSALDCNKWKTGCGSCPRKYYATKSYLYDSSGIAWRKMKSTFGLFKENNIIITGVSKWVKDRASESPILKGIKPIVVHNGVDENIFSPLPYSEMSNKYNISTEIVILYVTAYFETEINGHKGGKYILELAELLKEQNVKIIIAANYGSGDRLPDNVFYHGRTKTQLELAQLYSMADLTVITSVRETFSMPVAESLSCGTPVVGFKAGGPETIALKDYSEFVEYGNLDNLYESVVKWMKVKREQPEELSKLPQKARSLYSKQQMVNNYMEIYNKLI
tara:strand:- start:9556 stop:10785 length:1230 start_codon:yes stop_codon:yes gene_type:complete